MSALATPQPPTVPQVLAAMGEALAQMAALVKAMAEQLERERVAATMTSAPRRAVTAREASEELGISESSVRNAVKAGRLKAEWHGEHFYRIPVAEIEAYRRRAGRNGRTR